jgi:hypothetical protein
VDRAHSRSVDNPALYAYGFPELVEGVAPGAATDFTQAITGGFFVRLVTVRATLTTDGTAANREVTLECRNAAGSRYCVSGAPATVPASSTYTYTFSAFQPEAVWPVDTGLLIPLSPVIMRPTDSFRLHIVNAQAGDALSSIRWLWERFYSDSPPPG